MTVVSFDALDDADSDLVVVGTGFAGQASARRLADLGMRVLLLEQGNPDNLTDAGGDNYSLDVTGLPYPQTNTRLASFGGTSNLWSGQSHALSPRVFNDRGAVRGWPIAWHDYALSVPNAATWLNLGDVREELFGGRASNWWRSLANLTTDEFRLSTPIVRLGDFGYLRQIDSHQHQLLAMDIRVTDIHLNAELTSVESLEVVHLPSSRTKRLKVKNVLFACGGIEVARLFLWASRNHPRGPLAGGPRQLTGKFLMEHPHVSPMQVYFDTRVDISDTYWAGKNGLVSSTIVRPDDEFLERNDLTRFGVFFWDEKKGLSEAEAGALANDDLFGYRAGPYFKSSPTFMFEQFPTDASYVTLSEKRDTLGAPLARVHLQISAEDFLRFRRAIQLFGGLICQSGLARVHIQEPFRVSSDDDSWEIAWGYHHMGTTRMASDAEHGVVDLNCRVFGLNNCYVIGGSIFPTADYVNPTLSIVALAFRFAERFAARNVASLSHITFGTKRQFNYLLGDGWARPEQDGVWTTEHRAEISIPGPIHRISFVGHAFAPPGHEPIVDLEVNGQPVFSGSAHDLFKREFPLAEKPITTVVLHVKNPVSPLSCGLSDDARTLGIFLKAVRRE